VNFLRFVRRPPPRTRVGALELDVAASMAFLKGEDMALSPLSQGSCGKFLLRSQTQAVVPHLLQRFVSPTPTQ
jgi:hypothetical protein